MEYDNSIFNIDGIVFGVTNTVRVKLCTYYTLMMKVKISSSRGMTINYLLQEEFALSL